MNDINGNVHGDDGRFQPKHRKESTVPLTDVTAEPVTKMVRTPGEPPYEEVSTADNRPLGYCTYREGMYIASVHNGRAPKNVGEYWSREEALRALVDNDGNGQSRTFL